MDSRLLKTLVEEASLVLEGKQQHHYTSGADYEGGSKPGSINPNSTKHLSKLGDEAKKNGMKVSYSHGGKGRSGNFNPSKHSTIHISHHDDKHVEKLLSKHGHGGTRAELNDLKSKSHGGHSKTTAIYHHNTNSRTAADKASRGGSSKIKGANDIRVTHNKTGHTHAVHDASNYKDAHKRLHAPGGDKKYKVRHTKQEMDDREKRFKSRGMVPPARDDRDL